MTVSPKVPFITSGEVIQRDDSSVGVEEGIQGDKSSQNQS